MREQRPYKLKHLAPELRAELEKRLSSGSFTYRGLSKWLSEQGFEISAAGLQKYGVQLERRLDAVKLATAQALAVVEKWGTDDATLTDALLKLVQHQLFAVLVELDTSDLRKINLAAVARNIAEMGRSTVRYRTALQDFRERVADRAASATAKVINITRGAGGLSDAAHEEIKRVLMGIAE